MISDSQPVRLRARRAGLALGVAAAVLILDQVSKAVVLDTLGPGGDQSAIELIPGVLRFLYVENTGAAFGMFRGNSLLLTFLGIVVVGFLTFYFRRAVLRSSWLAMALGLQLGGALGNIIDRVRHGFVVDFIDLPHWPTFNVADSGITVGVVALGIYLFFLADRAQGSDLSEQREPERSPTWAATSPDDQS